MYIRFTTLQIDEDSHQPQGLFQLAYSLLDSGDLNEGERNEIQSLITWFKENLRIPNQPDVQRRAIFWYRETAQECIKRMWELANILRSHDYAVQFQRCQYLCNIVYSDEYQVAAYPHWRDAPAIIS